MDETGTLTDTYDYTAFGEFYAQTGTTPNTYLYTGQQYDAETGLYSLRARYYDPAEGRFLSRDTYAYNYQNPIELNRYGYAANNPITNYDPTGQISLTLEYTSVIVLVGLASIAYVSLYGEAIVDALQNLLAHLNAISDLLNSPAGRSGSHSDSSTTYTPPQDDLLDGPPPFPWPRTNKDTESSPPFPDIADWQPYPPFPLPDDGDYPFPPFDLPDAGDIGVPPSERPQFEVPPFWLFADESNPLKRLYDMLEAHGVTVQADADAEVYLNWASAQQGTRVNASTLTEDLIMIRPEFLENIPILLEEWFHSRQHAENRTGTDRRTIYELEIEAKTQVISQATEWGITQQQITRLRSEIQHYQNLLDSLE